MRVVALTVFAICVASCSKSTDIDVNDGPSGNDDGTLYLCEQEPDSSRAGPTMLPVGRVDEGCYWMDETEVTRADFAVFLDAVSGQAADDVNVPVCSGHNDAFEPEGIDLQTDVALPVAGVDWCDAAAYCAWADKRLCEQYEAGERIVSELESVCTDGDHADFDYVKLKESCNGDGSAPVAAGSQNDCVSPTGVMDLVGNVEEWTNECDGDGVEDACTVRGGSYASSGTSWGCRSKRSVPRDHQAQTLGFRCCRSE